MNSSYEILADSELEKIFTKGATGWEPSSGEEIDRLYTAISTNGSIPLDWAWEGGRRSPTPSQNDSDSETEQVTETVDTSGFDFDDEPMVPKLTPRRIPGNVGLKGSAKKRTTKFDNVLASVRRQHKLDAKHRIRKDKK